MLVISYSDFDHNANKYSTCKSTTVALLLKVMNKVRKKITPGNPGYNITAFVWSYSFISATRVILGTSNSELTASISLNFRSIGVSDRRGVGGRGDAEREIACELDRDPFCEPIGENPGELVISWTGYGD